MASRETIEKAFRTLVTHNQKAFLHQPDPSSVQRIQLAKQARDVLRDPQLRVEFERELDLRSSMGSDQKIRRQPVGMDGYAYDVPATPVNDEFSDTNNADLRHVLALLGNSVFRDDLNENPLRRPVLARRIKQILATNPPLNLEESVLGKVITIAARFIMETDCVQLMGQVLSYNANAPRRWMAALIEHPALRLRLGSLNERREVVRKLVATAEQFPRLKQEFAEALTVLAEDNSDLPQLQTLVSQPVKRVGVSERQSGGRRNRLY